jgi:hypothetical protein
MEGNLPAAGRQGFVVVAESDGDYGWRATGIRLPAAGRDRLSRWNRMVITDGRLTGAGEWRSNDKTPYLIKKNDYLR